MKTILSLIVVVITASIAGQAVAQDRDEILSRVSAIAELATANTDNITTLQSEVRDLQNAVFGLSRTVSAPVITRTVAAPKYIRTVERTYSAPVIQNVTRTRTTSRKRGRIFGRFFSQAAAACPGGS